MQASSGHRSARLLASSRIGSRSAISPPLPQKHTPLMVHPLSRTRSSSYSRFPPEPALSIQPVAERDGFARPGHVRDARKDGPNGATEIRSAGGAGSEQVAAGRLRDRGG